jgi:hypothetical protein
VVQDLQGPGRRGDFFAPIGSQSLFVLSASLYGVSLREILYKISIDLVYLRSDSCYGKAARHVLRK